MILNWLHNGAEYFVQIMCKFQKVICYRNETARSNVLPTVNKCFNCIICTCKGVALVPSVSVCLWCCSWIINTKMVATDIQCLGLCRRLHLIFFLSLSFVRSTIHLYMYICWRGCSFYVSSICDSPYAMWTNAWDVIIFALRRCFGLVIAPVLWVHFKWRSFF